jgi:AmiR/NasT family two-component response regulator
MDLKEILIEEGYDVVGETARGDDAIKLAESTNPDLVILDIKMPGVDGLQAADEINKKGTSAILILTAFSQRDLIERARDAGAMAYLIKPFQRQELTAAIEIAFARYQEAKALEEEVTSLQDRLEARKLLDKAKGRLMDEFELGEAEAFRFIQKTAMDKRLQMKEVAEMVLDNKLVPDNS